MFSARAWCQIDHGKRWIRTVWPFKKWVWFFSSSSSIPPLFKHGYKSPGGSDPIIDVQGTEKNGDWSGLACIEPDSLWSHWEEELGHLKDYWQVCLRKVILKYSKAGVFAKIRIILYKSAAWFQPIQFIYWLRFCHLKNVLQKITCPSRLSLCLTSSAVSADAKKICRWTFVYTETAVNGIYLLQSLPGLNTNALP